MGLSFPGTGMQVDKLWTNPAPKAAFAAQNVSLNLSGYKAILLRYTDATNPYAPDVVDSEILLADNTRGMVQQVREETRGSYIRSVWAEPGGTIHFGNCFSPTGEIANDVVVPREMYGLSW